MPPQADQAALTLAAYQRSTDALRRQLSAIVAGIWSTLGVYRNAQIGPFLNQVVPAVTGAQQQMATLTAAYLAHQRQAALGGALRPVPVLPRLVSGAPVRNGTPPATVYERPFHLVWRQLSDGVAPDQAIRAGGDRAVQSALTDLQLAKTRAAHRILTADPKVVGYYRQLEGPHSCALCIVASTQRYHKKDLMPIHPACDCQPRPLYGDAEPDQVIDPERLDAAHAAIRSEFGRSDAGARGIPGTDTLYRDVLIVHDHGELGPVLAVRHRPFRGPKDVGTDPREEAARRAAQQENQRRGESLLA